MRLSEIMQTPVRTIGMTEDANVAWNRMRQYRVRHLAVEREKRVVGIISAADLGGKHGEVLRSGRQVGDLLTEKLVVAAPDTTVREAANLMRGHAINCLPVFEGSTLKGIVTTLDLLELIGRGAERPVATAKRKILRKRGEQPRQQSAAKRSAGAKGRAR